MTLSLARSVVGAARLRPTIAVRALPAAVTRIRARAASDVPSEAPQKKAQSIIDSLPGNSLVSKAAIISAGAGLSAAAISNELYVVNEESIVMLSLLTVFFAMGKYGGPMYRQWAEGQSNKVLSILNSARHGHTEAVNNRINNVNDLSDVVDTTKALFEVAKETARLEAQAYELEQKADLAHEAKSVLDSWVRYESQVKLRQQKELIDAITARVDKEIENPKFLKQILDQNVADVERILAQKE